MRLLKIIFGFILVFNFENGLSAQSIKGTFAIENVDRAKVLRVKDALNGNGVPIVLYNPVNWKCVTWDFIEVGQNVYQLKNLFTGKTFQMNDTDSVQNFALYQQVLVANKPKQSYEFILVKDNIYLIRLKDSDLYLTPSGNSGEVNSIILLEKRKKDSTQYWKIYRQNPTM